MSAKKGGGGQKACWPRARRVGGGREVDCPNCGAASPQAARFCMSCGRPLEPRCAGCDGELPPAARFCPHCGRAVPDGPPGTGAEPAVADRLQQYIPPNLLQKLQAARQDGAGLGERRTVTMLFCDVQGSTAAAEGLDPEDWTELMNGVFAQLITPVYRYEGTVARLMGDAILAFFGAPIAHEDDPERAVLAGLEILENVQGYRGEVRDRWGIDFSVRVGIHTGLVVVGEVGSDLRVEYTAMGDAVNLAARMEQMAAPGTVQISGATHRLVAPLFETESLGSLAVKGKETPVEAYRVLAVRAEPGSRRGIEGLAAPLIGRDGELAALGGAVDELRTGRGQIVAVMGEAGLGKSRLTAELQKGLHRAGVLQPLSPPGAEPGRAPDARPGVYWLEGRCLSYRRETPFAPFIDLFSQCFELRPGLDEADRWRRLRRGLTELAPELTDEAAPYLAALLSIAVADEAVDRVRFLEPPELREFIFGAVSGLVERLAARQPLVLVLEDLHWSDNTSVELLEALLPLTDRAMLMLLVVMRPQRQSLAWRFHERSARDYPHRYLPLELKPLDEAESRRLIASLLAIEGLPDGVRNSILARAEGNPFFIEEVIRSFLDDGVIFRDGDRWRAREGVVEAAVPPTLASVLTARLDRLDERVRRVAETAAVIGRQFAADALRHVLGPGDEVESALTEMQRRELIREKSRLPSPVYQFKHALTQEAAYNSLLRQRRRRIHGRVAAYLAEAEPERAADVAHHFWAAGEALKALPYLVEAGDRAARNYAAQEAERWYGRALEVVDEAGDAGLARRAYQGLGSLTMMVGDAERARAIFEEMLAFADRHDDGLMRVSALNKLAGIDGLMQGAFAAAGRRLDQAEALAREYEDVSGLSEAALTRCQMCTLQADFDGVVRFMDRMADASRQLESKASLAMSLEHMAASKLYMGLYDEAWETIQACLEAARDGGDLYHESAAATVVAEIQLHNGDVAAARAAAEEGMAIARRIGAASPRAMNALVLGRLDQLQGNYESALTHYEEALAASRAASIAWVQPMPLAGLGTIHLRMGGGVEAARAYHAEAEELLSSPFASLTASAAGVELAFCALELGELEKAAKFLELGLTMPGPMTNLARPYLRTGSALVALARGELAEAGEHLAAARRQVDEEQLSHVLPPVALAQGLLAEAGGDPEEAVARFAEAREAGERLGFRPVVWEALSAGAALLGREGREAEAAAWREQARQVLAAMAATFTEKRLRESFLRTHLERTG